MGAGLVKGTFGGAALGPVVTCKDMGDAWDVPHALPHETNMPCSTRPSHAD